MSGTAPRTPWTAALAALLLSAPASAGLTAVADPPSAKATTVGDSSVLPRPRDILVRFKRGADASDRAKARRNGEVELERALPLRGLQQVDPEPGVSLAEAVARLERSPDVLYAEPNYPRRASVLPGDPLFGQLWALNNAGQAVNGRTGTVDADIDAPEAWDITTGSSNVTVAVIDSGLDYTHPDLSSNVWRNPGESGSGRETNGADDDGNGFVDDWRGWDWVGDDNDPQDENGHGTHVSGTIGAGNDGAGVVGISWRVGIMPLRILDAWASGYVSDLIRAYGYARAQGARLVNASIGGGYPSQAESDAIAAASGTLFVFTSGNGGRDNDAAPFYPCSYPLENVICVAASDQDDALPDWSSYGASSVDLAAPGVNVLSSVPGGRWEYWDGTSMATPQVTGAAALLWSRAPKATPAAVKGALLSSVDPKPSFAGKTVTGGRLNAYRAVRRARRLVRLKARP